MENNRTRINEAKSRFELVVDNQVSFINYKLKDGIITLIHTEVPEVQEGKGIASRMVKEAFEYIEERGLKVKPLCHYIIAFIKRHKEYERFLAEGVKIED